MTEVTEDAMSPHRVAAGPTFDDTLGEINESMQFRTNLENKFQRTLNAIRTGKLLITAKMLEEDGEIEFEDDVADEAPKASAKKKQPRRKLKGGSAATSSHKMGMMDDDEPAVEKKSVLPKLTQKRGQATASPAAGTLNDYIGLTTSDFDTPEVREYEERRRRAEKLGEKLEKASTLSATTAHALRRQLIATMDAPCYGRKTLAQKLQILREDPDMFGQLTDAVGLYRKQDKVRRELRNVLGRDPLKENKELEHHLPHIASERHEQSIVNRREHTHEVKLRRQRVRQRKFLERYMIIERTEQQQRRVEIQQKEQRKMPVPNEVLQAQGIANWIVVTMAMNWFAKASQPVKEKKEALEAAKKGK